MTIGHDGYLIISRQVDSAIHDPRLLWTLAALALVVVALIAVVVRRGRPFAAGDVFRASRWSRGNRLFPTQVLITPTSVVQYTPRWIGTQDESIHIAHVASVKIDTHLFFSDVVIETSGGSEPVVCHGHWKSDAIRIKDAWWPNLLVTGRSSSPGSAATCTRTCPSCSKRCRRPWA